MNEDTNEDTTEIKESAPDQEEIVETPPITIPSMPESPEDESPTDDEIELSDEDCELMYGVVLETAHGVIAKNHRELPDVRRAKQGKLLHSICKKYNIAIPTEFDIVIFGGALIADWQYMSAGQPDTKPDVGPAENIEEKTND